MKHASIILIVDDDPVGRSALKETLSALEYEIVCAAGGREALEKAIQVLPDLILLDVMMPDMDGYEVCRRMRADPLLSEVPIVMVTALDDRASRLAGIEAGADDYLTKPVDFIELQARVRTTTRLNRYRRLLDERTRFQWVVDEAQDGYLLLNENDEIVYANPQSRRYLGLSENISQSIGEPFFHSVQRHYACAPEEGWAQWSTRPLSEETGPLYLIRPESALEQAMWLQLRILDQNDGVTGFRLVRLQDVTAHMSTQRSMWSFHSSVRHKLNTPLHILRLSLDLLAEQPHTGALPEDVVELVNAATGGMQRLDDAVSQIFRFLDLPVQAQSCDGFDLQDLPSLAERLADSIGIDSPMAEGHFMPEVYLAMSESAIECVILELLQNAKKFHPDHDPQVRVIVAVQDAGRVQLKIVDDGCTLSREQLAKLWLPYYQNEKHFTGEVAGVGLGLSMIRLLMWEVGGACHVENRADHPVYLLN